VGIEVKDLPTPVVALAGLLVAFVLVTTFNDWKGARTAASHEARAVQAELVSLDGLPEGAGARTAAELICYGRSVVALEWPALADRRASPVTTEWAQAIDREYAALLSQDTGAGVDLALTQREQRVAARLDRLGAAAASVPAVLTVLLVTVVILGIGLLGYLAHPRIGKRLLLPVMVITGVLFGGALVVINDMDQPFSGIVAISPEAMERALATASLPADLPCDAEGRPLR
jgi:hypothetical protein